MGQAAIWDYLLCAGVLLLIVLPRFNRWPESEQGQFQGQPRDYIHDRVFFGYATTYLLTFALLAFSVSRFEELRKMIFEWLSASGDNMDSSGLLLKLHTLFGPQSFILYLAIIILLLQLPYVSRIDERWRSVLLTAARVPRAALGLKLQIVDAIQSRGVLADNLKVIVQQLSERGYPAFWSTILEQKGISSPASSCALMLVNALHLVKLNKQFEFQYPGSSDLMHIETRLNEIAAVLPVQNQDAGMVVLQEYSRELEKHVAMLAEILAKNCVKSFPDSMERQSSLAHYGFDLDFVDQKETKILLPVVLAVGGILASCVLIIMLFMILFDQVGVTLTRDDRWFTVDRIFFWSLGGWVSYAVAACFGLFFNEALKGPIGERNLATYVLAFVFATLGSCIFFLLSRETFRPQYLWLAVNFGILSLAVIRSRGRYFTCREEVQAKALQLSWQYAIISGFLQLLIHLSFRGLDTTVTNVVMFFLFGACRGFAVAFLVSYILMDCERIQQQGSRRRFPRVSFRRSVRGEIEGQPVEVFVKDVSEQGALLQFRQISGVKMGDLVSLRFGFGNMQGRVIAVQSHVVRICFDPDHSETDGIQRYISKEMGLAA